MPLHTAEYTRSERIFRALRGATSLLGLCCACYALVWAGQATWRGAGALLAPMPVATAPVVLPAPQASEPEPEPELAPAHAARLAVPRTIRCDGRGLLVHSTTRPCAGGR